MKAIARKPEMEIVFAADKPSLVGERARLPEPPRKLTVRGCRDPARPCRFDGAPARLP